MYHQSPAWSWAPGGKSKVTAPNFSQTVAVALVMVGEVRVTWTEVAALAVMANPMTIETAIKNTISFFICSNLLKSG